MNNFNSVRVTEDIVVKSFKEESRFYSELNNNKIFLNMGYNTPRILDYNTNSLEITFKTIRGESVLNSEQAIVKTIEIIASIVNDTQDTRNICEIRDYYCDLVIQNITLLDSRISKNYKVFKYIDLLRKEFKLSVFKDCKPDNFIYSSGKIYIIDFDYIRDSFFLADLAQFFSYYILAKPNNIVNLTTVFVKTVNCINANKLNDYIILIYLSIINSNMVTISRNSNTSNSMVKQKEESSYLILKNHLYL